MHDAVVGVGIDVADTTRFARLLSSDQGRRGERVWHHWFTEAETAQCRAHARPEAASLAATLRFAVKEAAYKAVGADFSGPVRWRDIEVLAHGPDAAGWRLRLLGEVEQAAARVGALHYHVSTCQVGARVVATVIATGVRPA